MKVEIKPVLVFASDYHEFYPYDDKNFMNLGFEMDYYELGCDGLYWAITWVVGDEEELFKVLFNNEKVWNWLTIDEYEN